MASSHRTRASRLGPGAFKCPACRHIVNNDNVVECIRPDKKKGKYVCTACGIAWLKSHDRIPKDAKGPTQTDGQISLTEGNTQTNG